MVILSLLLFFAFATSAHAGWYDSNWNYRKQIIIDASMTPNTDRSWFPALIYKATDGQLAASACPNGEDILFTKSDGTTKIDHEIEDFNNGTGELVAWVEIETLSSSIDTIIYIYYGNSGCINQENVPGTWDEGGSNNFKGVWHLSEDPSGIPPQMKDSTSFNNDGTSMGGMGPGDQVGGKVDGSLNFAGSPDNIPIYYIQSPDSASLNITGDITVSAWIKPTGGSVTQQGITNKRGVVASGWWLHYENSVMPPGENCGTDLIHWKSNGGLCSTSTVPRNLWTHVVGTLDAADRKIYINGLEDASSGSGGSIGDSSGQAHTIGYGTGFDGTIDEVRISGISRGADWIRTEFNNQSSPATYLSFGSPVTSISGTCKQSDQSTDCTDTGTIRIAVNGVLQAETQPTVAGIWTIEGVTPPNSGDVITVYIEGAANANEAVAVTKYDGTGNITGIQLIEEHLTIGSDDNQTLSNVDLSQYDNSVSGSEDVFHEVDASNDLTVDTTTALINEELYIKSGNTYRPDSASSGNVITKHMKILGALTADGNTFTVSGDWDHSSGTFTYDTSTVVMTGAANDMTAPAGNQFYNLTINSGANITAQSSFGTAIGGSLIISGTFNIAAGYTVYTQNNLTMNDNSTLSGAGTFRQSVRNIYTGNTYGVNTTISVSTYHFYANAATYVLPGKPIQGRVFDGNLLIDSSGMVFDTFFYLSDGDLTVNGDLTIAGGTSTIRTVFDNSVENRNITINNLIIGENGSPDNYTEVISGSGTLDINGDLTIHASNASGDNILTAGSSMIQVSGNWDSSLGTFNYNTSTVDLMESANLKTIGTQYTPHFYNLNMAAATKTTSLQSHVGVANNLTLGTGTVTGAFELGLFANSGTPLTDTGAIINISAFYYRPSNGTVTVTGGTNYTCQFWLWPSGSNATFNIGGPLTISSVLLVDVETGNSGVTVNTQNNAITVNQLTFGEPGWAGSSTFNFGSSTVDIGSGGLRVGSNGGSHTLNLNSANITNEGVWRAALGTGILNINPGTSSVTFDGGNQNIIGSTTFNNFTKVDSTNDATDVILGFDDTATQTINGTLTLDGLDADDRINLVSLSPGNQWTLNLAATAVKTIDFVDVTDSDASGSDATKLPVNPANSVDSGNNIDWFGTFISGTVYSDEGTTDVGAGVTVRLLINGVNSGTDDTDASGVYSISANPGVGDQLLVYIDEDDLDITTDGTTVTVSDGKTLNGFDIYYQQVITRHDNAGALTNALMKTAVEPYIDSEILYSVDGSNNLTAVAGAELFIPTGHSFTPGGNVTTQGPGGNIDLNGTITAGANIFTISADWDTTGGTFTYDTSTVIIGTNGQSNTITTDPAATWTGAIFYNLTIANGADIDINSGTGVDRIKVYGLLTVTGTLTIPAGLTMSLVYPSNNLTIDPTGEITGAGIFERAVDDTPTHIVNNGTISVDTFLYTIRTWSIARPITATTYGNQVTIKNWGSMDWACFLGRAPGDTTSDFIVPGTLTIWHDRVGKTLSFDNTVENIDISIGGDLIIGDVGNNTRYASFNAGSAAVTVGGNVIIAATDNPGTNFIGAGSSTWNVSGDWINNDTFIAGTSTIELNGGNQTISGSTTFNNLTKSESTNNGSDVTLTFDNTATQTINGTLTLDGLDDDDRINLVSDSPGNYWEIVVSATATRAIDYVDVSWSDASGSDAAKKPINPANSLDGGNTIDWFDFLVDAMIKLSSEGDPAYMTDNTYEATAAIQVKSQGVLSGSTVSYTLKFENDSASTDDLVITGTGDGSNFTIQYLDDTATDRTADVTGAGYTIASLGAGLSKVWTLNVTPAGNPTPVVGGTSYDVTVTATSSNDGTKTDQVQGSTTSTSANITLAKNVDKPNANPGDDLTYTTTGTNAVSLTDASNIEVTDQIPTNTGFKVGTATFNPLTSTLTSGITYSDDNGTSWTYTPVSTGCSAPAGYDNCVTDVKWIMTGNMPTNTSFSVEMVVRVK